jgi:GH24 family phage-related lysozyme (muramidase)
MSSPSSMSTNKRIAAAAALASAIAIPAEGVKLLPYYDPGGILTVCRGHTGPDVKPNQRFDLATATSCWMPTCARPCRSSSAVCLACLCACWPPSVTRSTTSAHRGL